MTVKLSFPFRSVEHLFTYGNFGVIIPCDTLIDQMNAHGYMYKTDWHVSFTSNKGFVAVFEFTDNQSAMMFTVLFK